MIQIKKKTLKIILWILLSLDFFLLQKGLLRLSYRNKMKCT